MATNRTTQENPSCRACRALPRETLVEDTVRSLPMWWALLYLLTKTHDTTQYVQKKGGEETHW